jgi:ABC-type lipoprotein release transport system permease subunit
MAKTPFTKRPKVKRTLRVAALGAGAGLSFMGVGNLPIFSMDAFESVLFGATGTLVGLAIGLFFTYALRGEVLDAEFNDLISKQVESVQAQTSKKDEK